jgi:hypothetical protein
MKPIKAILFSYYTGNHQAFSHECRELSVRFHASRLHTGNTFSLLDIYRVPLSQHNKKKRVLIGL